MIRLTPEELSKLSKEEKLALFDALEEKEKRQKLKKKSYVPNAGQLPVHKSSAMIRIVSSANGAGKTAMAIQEAKWRCDGYHPVKKRYTKVPTEVYVLLDQAKKADNIWVKEFKKWFVLRDEQLKKKGTPNTQEIHFDNGSRIVFLTQESPEMAFEGVSDYSLVVMDEPCPHWQFTALFRGARDKDIQPEFLLIGTPLGPNATWIRQMWKKWANGELDYVECFRTNNEVNRENLPEGFLEKFSEQLTDAERAVRMEGMFSDIEGLALAHLFKREHHVIPRGTLKWDQANPCVVVMDPHPSKAHVAILMGCDRENNIKVLREFSKKLVARDFMESIIAEGWFKDYRVIDIVYDSLGNTDGTGGEGFKSFGQVINEVLKKNGIGRARATTYDEKSDEDLVERLRDLLLIPKVANNFGQKTPKLQICEECKGAITDVEEVQWLRDKANETNKPKLDLRNTDRLACIKYGLATNLYFSKTKGKIYRHNKVPYGVPSRRKSISKLPARFPSRGRSAG